jgi:hypothetical protein
MVHQLVAELAGYFGDADTCLSMIQRSTDSGLFDLPWLDRCPLIESVRSHPEIAHARARVKRRADAVLDALYGDYQSRELTDTVVL